MSRIANDTGWHPRTVSRAILGLRRAGVLEVRRQYFARDNSLGPNRYYLPGFQNVIPQEGARFQIYGGFDHLGDWDESDV